MKNTILLLACLTLSSCATPIAPNVSRVPDEIIIPDLQNVGSTSLEIITITPTRISNDEIRVRVQIARNGHNEAISLEAQKLPGGLTSSQTTIAPDQQQAALVLHGKVTPESTMVLQLRSSKNKLERTVSLKSVASTQGGTHQQNLKIGTANLAPSLFAPTQIYANFTGSLCQVMVQGKGHGLYICFNGPLKAGRLYPLLPTRGLHNDTASVTYFQATTGASTQPGFWDSRSGFLTVKSLSKNLIELVLQEVMLEPAKGFASNPAQGEFRLEANTQIEDISNLPE